MKIKALTCLSIATLATGLISVQAQTIDGTLDGSYGSALSVQTVNTAWGSAPASSGGNQLDAAYGTISGGNLNLFFAGNTSDGNHLQVFLSDGRVGQSTFSGIGGQMTAQNGSVFSPGFSATYAIDVNTYTGTIYAALLDLVANTGGYTGAAPDAGGNIGGVQFAVNNSSPAGVGSNTGAGALGVTTGWEMSIPLSYLANPSSVKVLADISSGGLSNQLLPADGSVSGNTFNYGSTPGQYFTVTSVPEPTTLALAGLSGLATLVAARRRK
jgi:hypothetical protein